MDEECLRPGDPNDKTLLAKLNNRLGYHEHYISHMKADLKLQKIMSRDVSHNFRDFSLCLCVMSNKLIVFTTKEYSKNTLKKVDKMIL